MQCILKLKSDLERNNSKKIDLVTSMYWRYYKTYKSDVTKINVIKSDVTTIKFTKIIIMKKAYLEIGEGGAAVILVLHISDTDTFKFQLQLYSFISRDKYQLHRCFHEYWICRAWSWMLWYWCRTPEPPTADCYRKNCSFVTAYKAYH